MVPTRNSKRQGDHMRSFLLVLALAGFTAPIAALAQDAAGAPAPAWTQHSAAFEQAHQQIKRLHEQERAQMLGVLTPAHKQLVAQVAGQLAVAANPDFEGAVRKINASLSPAESQNVLRIHEQSKQQMHAIMEQAFKSLPADQQQAIQQHMQQHRAEMGNMQHQRPQPTAGALLLMPGHGGGMMGGMPPPM
jgi:hypothetical protein